MDWTQFYEKGLDVATLYGLKIIYALLIFVIGRWVARILKNLVQKLMVKSKVEITLVSFVGNITYVALLAFVILASLGQLGIQTTSFIAVLGAAGLAVGLALQGSLSNFAAGVLMIIFQPFKVGDKIEGAGIIGVVEEIQLFTTQLSTPDNKTIIVPNSKLTSDNITNYSMKGALRVDLVIGIGYGDDIDKFKSVILDELSKDSRILKDPSIFIGLLELGDSSVNFVVRPWVNTSDYWDVYFDSMENIKKRMDAEGLSIPFPQRDVHLYKYES